MAFQSQSMRSPGSMGRARLWVYETQDDVSTANYFLAFVHNLFTGNRIFVTRLTGTTFLSAATYVVTAANSAAVTVSLASGGGLNLVEDAGVSLTDDSGVVLADG